MDASTFSTLWVFVLWVLTIAAGIFFLWKVLSRFFETRIVLLTSLLILFGTNYLSLVLFAGPTADTSLFTLYLALILLTDAWQKQRKWMFLVAMVPVITVICFFWFSEADKCFFAPPANIHRVLFSVKNGWLVYSPVVIFAFAGFYFLAEKNRNIFYAASLFMLVSLISAAGNPTWWFADRFGYPNLVETYAVLCIPLGYFVQWAWNHNKITNILLFVLSGFLVSLNLFETWQFQQKILLPERMTPKYYCATFGRVNVTNQQTSLPEPAGFAFSDTIPSEPWITCGRIINYDFENPVDQGEPFRLQRAAHSGNYGMLLNSQHRYSPGLAIPVGELTKCDSSWISATGYFYSACDRSRSKVFLVITCIRHGVPYKYKVTDLAAEKYHSGQWNLVTMSYLVPFSVDPADLLKVYFLNYGNEACFIDDFEISLCKPIIRI